MTFERKTSAMQHSRKVLVVEDEGLLAFNLEEMLQDLGHQVVGTAARVEAAARILEREPVELVVLDVNLNGTLSYGLAETLRSRGVPFVFATGYGSAGLETGWRSVPVVQKPFSIDQLRSAIAEALAAGAAADASTGRSPDQA
jgi:CheY-like chemotaxis protein